MSAGLNQAIILGRLIGPLEHISTKSGSVMLKATLEVSTYRRTSDGANEEQTTHVPVTLFGKLAQTFEQYVEVGHLVQLVGRLDGYEKKGKDGASWLTLSFVAEQLVLLPNGKRDTPTPVVAGRDTGRRQARGRREEFGKGFQQTPRAVTTNEYGEPSDISF